VIVAERVLEGKGAGEIIVKFIQSARQIDEIISSLPFF
jgi:hypothetical protein